VALPGDKSAADATLKQGGIYNQALLNAAIIKAGGQ